MIQTYLEQNHIYEGDQKAGGPVKITYAGYCVPHPLRDEMVLRIGVEDGEITTARKAFAEAAKGCVQLFQNLRHAWRAAILGPAEEVKQVSVPAQKAPLKSAMKKP
jgi:hypothetical protein